MSPSWSRPSKTVLRTSRSRSGASGTNVPVAGLPCGLTHRIGPRKLVSGTFVPVIPPRSGSGKRRQTVGRREAGRPVGKLSRTVAGEVRARRRALGLTQQDLAELAGVSERFVRFVEQAKASVQLDALEAVLGALGLELRLAGSGEAP